MSSIDDLVRAIVREEISTGVVALSKAQAVEYLGGPPITVKTLEALVRRREIGFLKIGRALVFPRAELDAYIAAHTVKPVENSWGLTDAALRRIREDRSGGRGRTF